MYEYLGMTARAYVARGLALKRAVELGGTEVGVGGPPPEGESTSPSPLPTKKPKRVEYEVIGDCHAELMPTHPDYAAVQEIKRKFFPAQKPKRPKGKY